MGAIKIKDVGLKLETKNKNGILRNRIFFKNIIYLPIKVSFSFHIL